MRPECGTCGIKKKGVGVGDYPKVCLTIRDCPYFEASNKDSLCTHGQGEECLCAIATDYRGGDIGHPHYGDIHVFGIREMEIHSSYWPTITLRFNNCPMCGGKITWHGDRSASCGGKSS